MGQGSVLELGQGIALEITLAIRRNKGPLITIGGTVSLILLGGCAADLKPPVNSSNTNTGTLAQQNLLAASLTGATVTFNYLDYYTLTSPNPTTGCAGDVKNYYDPIALATRYPASLINTGGTIYPSFIKNVSVDITDANASGGANHASTCSYGSGAGAPPPSNCATFDYGAIGGLPSTLGGTLLIIGGLSSQNYTGIQSSFLPDHGLTTSCGPIAPPANLTAPLGFNVCPNSVYALGIDSLPASGLSATLTPGLTSASGPISSWENLSGATAYKGPTGSAGAAATYDPLLQKVMVFGGSAPLTGLGSTGTGSNTADTWVYNITNQTWTEVNSNISVPISLQNISDFTSTAQTLLPKSGGGRSVFGYAAVPGMAISQLSTTGLVSGAGGAGIDTTDRIVTAGGLGSCYGGSCVDAHRMNPTYGPEYFDGQAALSQISATSTASPFFASQWIDSYYQQLISNTSLGSNLFPNNYPSPNPGPGTTPTSINFGMVALNNNNPLSNGLGVSTQQPIPTTTNTSTPGAGYLLVAGGFFGALSSTVNFNTPSGAHCLTIFECGGMQMSFKWFGGTLTNSVWSNSWNATLPTSEFNERSAANFASLTNWQDIIGSEATPLQWGPIPNGGSASGADNTPWFGGGVLLKGINLGSSNPGFDPGAAAIPAAPAGALNEVVFFGGADCKNYLTDPTTCPNWPAPGNPGKYWVFGSDPAANYNGSPASGTTANFPSTVAFGGTTFVPPYLPPRNAGMAAARGTDASNNPILVAWGGMSQPATADTSGNIYYLYNNNGVPTWGYQTIASGLGPAGLGNASLVFSHTTGKFYLFGGYSAATLSVKNTWELSLSKAGTSATCGVGSSPSCVFSWRLLDSTAGLTCYPSCPPARRSHRMVEANYHYFNAPLEPVCTSAQHPCSFGLFMEGGTSDGTLSNIFGDRWMFDPTASGGGGHWQLMGELPPRSLASLANVDYTPLNGSTAHRAILFGGETGMENPSLAQGQSTGYFVPPTLGDTWMFDYDTKSWNRVTLLGQRYPAEAIPSFPTFTEAQARAASLVTDTTTQVFSPPPLSGAVMITRTLSRSNHLPTDTPKPLAIPEVFLFGGRQKSGNYSLLNQVYKFCAGTTGEKPANSLNGTPVFPPDDASCDAYDPDTNPNSPSPSSTYVGRWLLKTPQGTGGLTPSQLGSFMGAGAYDSIHDRMLLFGGLQPIANFATASITDSTNRSASGGVLEYTPPSAIGAGSSASAIHGSWATIPSCVESPQTPAGRYGHSLAYNPLNQSLILVGGYGINGNLLTQTQVYYDGRTYSMPEVWKGFRIDTALPNGLSAQNIPVISTGPCYYWTPVTLFGNSIDIPSQTPPLTGLAHMTTAFIPSAGYNTGYYSTYNNSCSSSGPLASSDPAISGILAGGAYFDIDRTQLGATENLILNLTFVPLGLSNIRPDQSPTTQNETAIFKIHLVKTGQTGDQIRQAIQPRYLTYASTTQYPEVAQDLAILSPPNGQIRQEQVYIPLSLDPGIDRIRIERYSGNAILIDATLMRLGHH